MKKLGLYIHWPFCLSKCPYCDFNSRPLSGAVDEEVFARAYEKEMDHYARLCDPRPLSSVYFGGGTPSLMRAQTVDRLLQKAEALWSFDPACEVTIEANPSTYEVEKFQAYRSAGVNRLSLGVQSLRDEALLFLGRSHDAQTARFAIEAAQKIFPRFTFDLIYARQNQTATDWAKELEEALSFETEHLSLYQLTIEEGTPFYKRAQKEQLRAEDNLAAELFEQTQTQMEQAGLPSYEISNYARPKEESRHNLLYWQYEEYMGIGAGAHARFVSLDGRRMAIENHRKPEAWLSCVQEWGLGACAQEELSLEAAMDEALMMGLRLRTGINKASWVTKFGVGLEATFCVQKKETLKNEGLLIESETTLSASEEGRQKLNAVLAYLL